MYFVVVMMDHKTVFAYILILCFTPFLLSLLFSLYYYYTARCLLLLQLVLHITTIVGRDSELLSPPFSFVEDMVRIILYCKKWKNHRRQGRPKLALPHLSILIIMLLLLFYYFSKLSLRRSYMDYIRIAASKMSNMMQCNPSRILRFMKIHNYLHLV